MSDLIVIGLLMAWGGLCFLVGRIISVNKAISNEWPEYYKWKIKQQAQELEDKH